MQAELRIVNKVCPEKSPKASESHRHFCYFIFILSLKMFIKELEAMYYGPINSSGYPDFIKLSVSYFRFFWNSMFFFFIILRFLFRISKRMQLCMMNSSALLHSKLKSTISNGSKFKQRTNFFFIFIYIFIEK